MLDKIRQFLQQRSQAAAGSDLDKAALIARAAAILFVEVMYADHEVDAREAAAVQDALQACFNLDADAAQALLNEARQQVEQVTPLHEFTSLLHRNLGPEEKQSLLEQIWRIVMADERVDKYEEHLVRRIASLLHVSHSDFIRAKHKAQQAMNSE